jgi:MFS family permease
VNLTRALRHRDFRLFFTGQSISLIGTWMQIIAMSWLVYRLSGSPFVLGLVGFCGQLPSLLLSPLAGVLADRWPRKRILLVTQTASMLQALTIAALVFSKLVAVWQIILLSIVLGCVNAFDIPARQSLLVDMVKDRADLGNAIALNSSMVNGARLVGPAIAGVLIGWVGEGTCFLLNGLSYLAVLAALIAMRPTQHAKVDGHPEVWTSLKEGFAYVSGFAPVRTILLLLALVSLMGMPYSVLMPVFAERVLHGGPHTYGFLMSSAGVGALGGAVYLASRANVLGMGRILVIATSLFGTGLVAFSFSTHLAFSMACLVVSGCGMIISLAGSNTILQTIVDDDKRGRLMSFYTMSFMGMVPLGSFMSGALASHFGAPITVRLGGCACVIGSMLFASRLGHIRELIRPIYREKGILPSPPENT